MRISKDSTLNTLFASTTTADGDKVSYSPPTYWGRDAGKIDVNRKAGTVKFWISGKRILDTEFGTVDAEFRDEPFYRDLTEEERAAVEAKIVKDKAKAAKERKARAKERADREARDAAYRINGGRGNVDDAIKVLRNAGYTVDLSKPVATITGRPKK